MLERGCKDLFAQNAVKILCPPQGRRQIYVKNHSPGNWLETGVAGLLSGK